MAEDVTVHRLLHRIHKEITMKFKHKLEPYDFTRGEFPFLLGLIKRGDGVTQKEICDRILISKSTTSKMINNLVEKGYLKKKVDEDDKRATRIYLTDKKKEIENIVQEIDEKAEDTLMEGFDEEEKKQIREYLEKMLMNIEGNM